MNAEDRKQSRAWVMEIGKRIREAEQAWVKQGEGLSHASRHSSQGSLC